MNLHLKLKPKDLVIAAIILAVYFAAGKLGLNLAFVNESATAVWPPSGIALAVFFIFGYRFWPVILVGAFLVNFTTSGIIPTSIGIAIGNTLEGLVGAYLVNRFANGRYAYNRPRNIFKFVVLAGMLATAISASVGVSTLVMGKLASSGDYGSIWLTWWLGDLTGALIVAPLLLLWSERKVFSWDRLKLLEIAIFLGAFALMTQLVFGNWFFLGRENYPLGFLVLPFLLWPAFRYGKRATAATVVILSSIAVWGTLQGFGPFVLEDKNASLIILQLFTATMGTTVLAVASLMEQIREANKKLLQSHQEIHGIVESITDAFMAFDKDWRFIYVNSQAEKILGKPKEELLGKVLGEMFPESLKTESHKRVLEGIKYQKTTYFEELYPSFKKWFRVAYYPSEKGLSVYFQDITQLKELEENLRKQSGQPEIEEGGKL